MVTPILESLYCHTCLVDATRSRRTYAMTPKLETVRNRAVYEPLLGPGRFTLSLMRPDRRASVGDREAQNWAVPKMCWPGTDIVPLPWCADIVRDLLGVQALEQR